MDVEDCVISDLVITKEGSGVVYRMRPDEAQQGCADIAEGPPQGISDKQLKRLFAIAGERSVTENQLKKTCMTQFGKEHLKDMTKSEYDKLVSVVEKEPKTGGKA